MNIFSASSAKLGMFPDELLGWRTGEAITPITLEIQPSEQCNHRCPKCQAQFSLSRQEHRTRVKAGQHLDLGCLEGIWERPPRGVVLSRNSGDPLLHPRLGQL